MNHSEYDVVIVGARCAGASTAMLLARRGLRVLAVDRSSYGADALSTHALMRGGVVALRRWGVLDAVRARTPAIRTTAFHYGSESVTIPIKPRDGVDALYAPRRTHLDAVLVDAARDAGAEVVHHARVTHLLRSDSGRVEGVELDVGERGPRVIRAPLVIGADGMKSAVARMTDAPCTWRGTYATAILYGYFAGANVRGYEWHYGKNAGVGAIPTAEAMTCVFVALPPSKLAGRDASTLYGDTIVQHAPELACTLANARFEGTLRTFGGAPGWLKRASGPGWALVGDAGSFKDPFTAHGISDALRDAELLADAVGEGTDAALARYEAERDALTRPLAALSDQIASFRWSLTELPGMHEQLVKLMNAGVRALTARAAPPATRATRASLPDDWRCVPTPHPAR